MTDCKHIILCSLPKDEEYNEIEDYDNIYSTLNEYIVNDLVKICMDYLLFDITNQQHLYDKYHPHCIRIDCEKVESPRFKFRIDCYRKYISTMSYCSVFMILKPNNIKLTHSYIGTKCVSEHAVNDSIYCAITKNTNGPVYILC